MNVDTVSRRRFDSQLSYRSIQFNGKEHFEFEGYASVFSRGYEMYDAFGSYSEVIDPGAFDSSMSRKPDVAFLVNHKGLAMARTTAGNLDLSTDSTGLHVRARLNAARADVRDLALATEDRIITEMSFAFMLNDGVWDEDFTEFWVTEADINRGDVSAVNYGANPYTSIEARAGLGELESMLRSYGLT